MNNNASQFFIGVVENRMDPLKLGRCQVRIIGMHTHDKAVLPTADLPWAYPMQPAISAAMNGIGHAPVGPVEGTSAIIVFADYPDNQQPIIVGTLGGIPQKENVNIGRIDDEAAFKDPATGVESPVPTSAAESEQRKQQAESSQAAQSSGESEQADQAIPTEPPPTWKGDRARASAAIAALLAACDKYGLSTKEQKCALLGIVGGESGWIPQKEGYSYTADRLQTVFKTTFGGKPDLAAKYARWQGSRESFFNFVYAPENNGSSLGNTQSGDGGKFYGRGLIQLTGRSNYERYAKQSGKDIVSNPELLNSDLTTSAEIAVLYLKDRVPKSVVPTSNPGYFQAAKACVGNNTSDIAAKKLSYYEYFYGDKTPQSTAQESDATNKSTSATPPSDSNASPNNPPAGPGSPAGGAIGFKDPNGKYPLKTLINEPDTHRLARSVYTDTIVAVKEAERVVGIPIALDQGSYNQPSVPYGAIYPYNHTFESESGHMMEFDDTAGYERIHLYHRSGTFMEVDANGSEVHKIVGDGYTIYDRNGCIYVRGECNVTVDGNINVFCRSDANIEVSGNATTHVNGNYDLKVGGNMTTSVAGDYKLWVGGMLSLQSSGVGGDGAQKGIHFKTGTDFYFTSAGAMNFQSGKRIALDAPSIWLNSGKSKPSVGYSVPQLTAGTPLRPTYEYLEPPPLRGEETFQFETEEEWNTEEGRSTREDIAKQYGDETPENTPAQEQSDPTGGKATSEIASCAIINSTKDFSSDYRLSPHFTLGMLFYGGYNVQHRLVDQNGLTKQEIVCNLAQLCTNVLEPMVAVLPGGWEGYNKQWKINSGYRQGSGSSDHGLGRAIDIGLYGGGISRNKNTYELAKQVERIVPYDQMIMEYRTPGQVWFHVGYRGTKVGDTSGGGVNRRQAFTMLNDKTYGQGIILL
jgi:predicted chitinase